MCSLNRRALYHEKDLSAAPSGEYPQDLEVVGAHPSPVLRLFHRLLFWDFPRTGERKRKAPLHACVELQRDKAKRSDSVMFINNLVHQCEGGIG